MFFFFGGDRRIALAQSYIHLRPYELLDAEFEKLHEASMVAAESVTKRMYGTGYAAHVRTEEGSWKVWITLLGIGGAALHESYDAVSKYPDFKHGMKELCKDAKVYGADVCGVLLPKTGASKKQTYVVQQRTMVPGKVYQLLLDADRLEKELPNLSKSDIQLRLHRLTERIRQLGLVLPESDMTAIRKTIAAAHLPISPDAFEVGMPKVALREDRNVVGRTTRTTLNSSDIVFDYDVFGSSTFEANARSGHRLKQGIIVLGEDDSAKKQRPNL